MTDADSRDDLVPLEEGLEPVVFSHLYYGFWPPYPKELVPTAIEVIRLGLLGRFDDIVKVPDDVEQEGGLSLTVRDAIARYRLHDFIEDVKVEPMDEAPPEHEKGCQEPEK